MKVNEVVKKSTEYVCEICGGKFSRKSDCEWCESHHLGVVGITGVKYRSLTDLQIDHNLTEYYNSSTSRFDENSKRPPSVLYVEMEDGKKYTYTRNVK